MSKIFKISGNFKKRNKWAKPDPYFEGEIIMRNDGIFYGYSTEPKETKYLVGVITETERGISDAQFYMMSNDYGVSPIFYNTHGGEDKLEGAWHEMKYQLNSNHMCTFVSKGEVWVKLEKQPYSGKSENRIETKFGKLKQGTVMNSRIINSILEFS